LFEKGQPSYAFANGSKIGQGTTQPALIDVKLATSLSCLFDGFLSLFLATDEQDLASASRYAGQKVGRCVELPYRLRQINDVDRVPLLEDVWLHLRVPALGLMPKMNPCFEELGH